MAFGCRNRRTRKEVIMRKIEFRGKNFVGKWCYGYYLHDGQRGRHVITDGLLDINGVVPDTIGQFTGLYDKNGTPVYEGDIFDLREFCIKVVYESKYGRFELRSDVEKGMLHLDKGFCSSFVIVGNIHDNPELMKGGRK